MDQALADTCKIASELYSPYDSKASILLKELALVTALNGETQVSLRYHVAFASVVSVETLRGPVATLPLFDRKTLKVERLAVSELRYTSKLLGFRTHIQPKNRIVLLNFLEEDPEGNGLDPKLSCALRAVSGTIDAAVSEAGWGDPKHPELQDFLCEPSRVEILCST